MDPFELMDQVNLTDGIPQLSNYHLLLELEFKYLYGNEEEKFEARDKLGAIAPNRIENRITVIQ